MSYDKCATAAEAQHYWSELRWQVDRARREAEAATERYFGLRAQHLDAEEQVARLKLFEGFRAEAQWHVYMICPERANRWRSYGQAKAGRMTRSMGAYVARARSSPAWDAQVAKDVPRSLVSLNMPSSLSMGSGRHTLEETLRAMLRAWLARSKEESFGTGYVQGMNLRCALPCAVLGNCEAAFGLCSMALEDLGLPGTFSAWPPLEGVMVARELLREEIEVCLPRLAAALGDQLDNMLGLLAPQWLIPLFVGALPAPVLVRVWDDLLKSCAERQSSDIDVCTLWWVLALLSHFEDRAILAAEAGAAQCCQGEDAFRAVHGGCGTLPDDWQPPEVPMWDPKPVRRRHAELLVQFRAEVAESRLSRGCALRPEQVAALRSEFEHLRRRRSAEIDVEPDEDLGVEFAPDTHIVLAVKRGLPVLTGWRLTAIGGACFGRTKQITGPWRTWPVTRWEWQSQRHGGWETFNVADACLLEQHYMKGKGRLDTRALSFNAEARQLFTYDFEKMDEFNHETKRRRNIHRRKGVASEVLRHWGDGPNGFTATGKVRLRFEAGGELLCMQSQVWNARAQQWEPPPPPATQWTDSNGRPFGPASPPPLPATSMMGRMFSVRRPKAPEPQPAVLPSGSHRGMPRGVTCGGEFMNSVQTQSSSELPQADWECPPACRFEGPWRVDTSVGDSEGWLYASAPDTASPGTRNFHEDQRPGDVYRRRRWVRGFQPLVSHCDVADASQRGISLPEVGSVMARVCPTYSLDHLPALFMLLDVQGTQEVTMHALSLGLSLLAESEIPGKLRILFDLYDDDADERLSAAELTRLILALIRTGRRRRQVGPQGATLRASAGAASDSGGAQRPLSEGTVVTVVDEAADQYKVHWFQSTRYREGWVRKSDLLDAEVCGRSVSPNQLPPLQDDTRPPRRNSSVLLQRRLSSRRLTEALREQPKSKSSDLPPVAPARSTSPSPPGSGSGANSALHSPAPPAPSSAQCPGGRHSPDEKAAGAAPVPAQQPDVGPAPLQLHTCTSASVSGMGRPPIAKVQVSSLQAGARDEGSAQLSEFQFGESGLAEDILSDLGVSGRSGHGPGFAAGRRRSSFWRQALDHSGVAPTGDEEEDTARRLMVSLCGKERGALLSASEWVSGALQEPIFWRALIEVGATATDEQGQQSPRASVVKRGAQTPPADFLRGTLLSGDLRVDPPSPGPLLGSATASRPLTGPVRSKAPP
eukprot:TRINITY_DN1697_c0_g4_i1.p1 TRINITY_DN1697_c0_g4~~TRINITY_DN1697_c0_g4_i1.p1  ORF type:complete len:1245 (+),score=267.19 TRINITY_DN1697_c0_g4_i1:92-3736(+)